MKPKPYLLEIPIETKTDELVILKNYIIVVEETLNYEFLQEYEIIAVRKRTQDLIYVETELINEYIYLEDRKLIAFPYVMEKIINELFEEEMVEYMLTKKTHIIGHGTHEIYRFPNDYGASVIQHNYSSGGEEGLYELCVIKFYGENEEDYNPNYETYITDGCIGWLERNKVNEILKEIKKI